MVRRKVAVNRLVAITGGIASGKSTALKIIEKLGYKTFNADKTYKKLLLDEDFVCEISSKLNISPIEENGRKALDKRLVSKLVFNDEEKLKILNSVTHPKIMDTMITSAKECNSTVFLEVPLLYEGNFENLFDFVLVLTRADGVRFESASKRDGKTVEEIKEIAQKQFNYANITNNAHTFIIENNGDEDCLAEKIKVAIKTIES